MRGPRRRVTVGVPMVILSWIGAVAWLFFAPAIKSWEELRQGRVFMAAVWLLWYWPLVLFAALAG